MIKINLIKIAKKDIRKFDIIYLECYDNWVFGFVDLIDVDTIIIKDGFGKKHNFVAWFKDNPKMYKATADNSDFKTASHKNKV